MGGAVTCACVGDLHYRKCKAYIPPERKIPGVGVGVGQCTRRQNFVLPNAKYTNMLVYFALGNAHFSRFTRRVLPDTFYPTRFTRRQSVEYRRPSGVGAGVGHVHFIFFV